MLIYGKTIMDIIKGLQEHTNDSILFSARFLGYPDRNFFLKHPHDLRNLVAVG